MSGALDAFRAQQEAADRVHARLTEVARLLERLHAQAGAIARDADLRAALRNERDRLSEARQFLAEVRYLREQERLRYWPGLWRRWAVALLFALASVAAFGAAFGRFSAPGQNITTDVILNDDRPGTPRR